MAGIGNQTEQDFMAWLFKQTNMPNADTQLNYSLHSADPGDAGANELTNLDSPGYARAQLNPDVNAGTNVNYSGITDESGASVVYNGASITWPTATGPWNNGSSIPYFGAFGSGGNFLFGGTINGGPGISVPTGLALTCVAGNFRVTVD